MTDRQPPTSCPSPSSRPGIAVLAAGLALIAVALAPAEATAADPTDSATVAVRAGAAWLTDGIPAGLTESRDRSQAELSLWWRPHPAVTVGAEFDALRADRWPAGEEARNATGPGDLRLHTRLRLWEAPVRGQLAWQVKLPNADDTNQLGTDETDVHLALRLSGTLGPLALAGSGGVAVIGLPRQATAQAWAPELAAKLRLDAGPVRPLAGVYTRLPAKQQPLWATASLGLEGGCPFLSGVEASAGLSDAAPDLGLRGWIGWGFGCQDQGAGTESAESTAVVQR